MTFTVPPRVAPFLEKPFPMLGAWLVTSLLAILIPVIHWNKKKNQFYNQYGAYIEYENQQQENNNGYNYPSCMWFQWRCRQKQYQYMQYNNNSGDNQNWSLPGWFRFMGGMTEQDQRFYEENNIDQTNTGALKFVYAWTLIMFLVGVVGYGGYTIYKRRPISILAVIMFIFSQFALLMLILLPQGVISTDDRDLEDEPYGWHGQLSVLMVYTDFWLFLFNIGWCVFFGAMMVFTRYYSNHKDETYVEGGYGNMDHRGRTTEPVETSDKNATTDADEGGSWASSVRAIFGQRNEEQPEKREESDYTEPDVQYKSMA